MTEVLPDKNYLMVQVGGGLGNRLRAMLSAFGMAGQTNRELVVFWNPKSTCKARFTDLFSEATAERFNVIAREPHNRECDLIVRGPYCTERMARLPIPRVLMRTNKIIGDHSVIPWSQLFEQFKLNDYIAEQTARPMDEYFGVHVRGGDNAHTNTVPLQDYFDELDNRGRKLFLATDEPDVELAFKDRYGSKVLTFKKRTLARNRRQGIQDAFIDMLLLSKCMRIYGLPWSSFGRIAGWIGSTPFTSVERVAA